MGIYTPPNASSSASESIPFGYGFKEGLVVSSLNSSTGSVTFRQLALRGITRDSGSNPVVPNSEAKLLSDETVSFNKATVGNGGFLASPVNDTLYRIFVVANADDDADVICVPYTSDDWRDDLPATEDIDEQWTHIRDVGEVFVDSSGNLLPFFRSDDDVLYGTPREVFTTTSLATVAAVLLPDEIPEGLELLDIYAHSTTNTSSDVAMQIANSTSQIFEQHQCQNVGFEAYVNSPTGLQGPSARRQVWDGLRFARVASMKSGFAATGSQSMFIAGYRRKAS